MCTVVVFYFFSYISILNWGGGGGGLCVEVGCRLMLWRFKQRPWFRTGTNWTNFHYYKVPLLNSWAIFGAFSGEKGSALAYWPVCSCTVWYVASCEAVCVFWELASLSLHKLLVKVKVNKILTPAYFCCFQHINLKNRLFTYCPIPYIRNLDSCNCPDQ